MNKIFSHLKVLWQSLWGNFPTGWEGATETLIVGLNKAKTLLSSPGAASIASIFPNGLGTVALNELVVVINDALPELEIAHDASLAVKTLKESNPSATPEQEADVIIQTILSEMNKLPPEWQKKHWEDIAAKILEAILKISTAEAKSIINIKFGQLAAKES